MTLLPSSTASARQVVGILDHVSAEPKTYTMMRNKYEIQFGGGYALYDQAGNAVMKAVKGMMAGITYFDAEGNAVLQSITGDLSYETVIRLPGTYGLKVGRVEIDYSNTGARIPKLRFMDATTGLERPVIVVGDWWKEADMISGGRLLAKVFKGDSNDSNRIIKVPAYVDLPTVLVFATLLDQLTPR